MKYTKYSLYIGALACIFAFAPTVYAEAAAGGVSLSQDLNTKVSSEDGEVIKIQSTSEETKIEQQTRSGEDVKIQTRSAGETADLRMETGETGQKKEIQNREEREQTEQYTQEGDSEHATGTARALLVASEYGVLGIQNAEFHMNFEKNNRNDAGTSTDIDSAINVRSTKDFERFVSFKVQNDERIQNVDVKDGQVEVEYAEPAKLFGIIGTNINAHVAVDKEGNVEVKYPWYHIFMKKTTSSASLQSALVRTIAAQRKAEQELVASSTVRADISFALGVPNLFEIIADTLRGGASVGVK